jgi:hypothetical protein
MAEGRYRYDVFISYSRATDWPGWVEEKFTRVLRHWLSAELGRTAEIFLDVRSVGPGQDWPEALEEGLAQSRALISLLSKTYFSSDWCRRELGAMLARRDHLRDERGISLPLVFPMRIHDSEQKHVPEVLHSIQTIDISTFAEPFMQRESPLLEGLSRELRSFCEQAAPQILRVPEDSFRWPLAAYAHYLPRLTVEPPGQTSVPGRGVP